MANDKDLHIRVSGGYCLDCKTYFVELRCGDLPPVSVHGLSHDAAESKWKAMRDMMDGTTESSVERRVAKTLDILDGTGACEGVKPVLHRPMGKARFG